MEGDREEQNPSKPKVETARGAGGDWRLRREPVADFLLKQPNNQCYLHNRPQSKVIFTNGLNKGVSSTHALKSPFCLPEHCPKTQRA
jgi:hypothetical protein